MIEHKMVFEYNIVQHQESSWYLYISDVCDFQDGGIERPILQYDQCSLVLIKRKQIISILQRGGASPQGCVEVGIKQIDKESSWIAWCVKGSFYHWFVSES